MGEATTQPGAKCSKMATRYRSLAVASPLTDDPGPFQPPKARKCMLRALAGNMRCVAVLEEEFHPRAVVLKTVYCPASSADVWPLGKDGGRVPPRPSPESSHVHGIARAPSHYNLPLSSTFARLMQHHSTTCTCRKNT